MTCHNNFWAFGVLKSKDTWLTMFEHQVIGKIPVRTLQSWRTGNPREFSDLWGSKRNNTQDVCMCSEHVQRFYNLHLKFFGCNLCTLIFGCDISYFRSQQAIYSIPDHKGRSKICHVCSLTWHLLRHARTHVTIMAITVFWEIGRRQGGGRDESPEVTERDNVVKWCEVCEVLADVFVGRPCCPWYPTIAYWSCEEHQCSMINPASPAGSRYFPRVYCFRQWPGGEVYLGSTLWSKGISLWANLDSVSRSRNFAFSWHPLILYMSFEWPLTIECRFIQSTLFGTLAAQRANILCKPPMLFGWQCEFEERNSP